MKQSIYIKTLRLAVGIDLQSINSDEKVNERISFASEINLVNTLPF